MNRADYDLTRADGEIKSGNQDESVIAIQRLFRRSNGINPREKNTIEDVVWQSDSSDIVSRRKGGITKATVEADQAIWASFPRNSRQSTRLAPRE